MIEKSQPLRPAHSHARRTNHSFNQPRKSGGKGIAGVAIAVIAVVIIAAVGITMFLNRPFDITVDGKQLQVKKSDTIEDVYRKSNSNAKPGDLISLNGALLEDGKGGGVICELNGMDLGPNAGKVALREGDAITFKDGEDITEDSVDDVVETPLGFVRADSNGAVSYISDEGRPRIERLRKGALSGEVVNQVDDEGSDRAATWANIEPSDGQKLVAITFDDGPSKYTPLVLDILNAKGVKATFFVLGKNVDSNPAAAKRVVDEGHEIANHSMGHLDYKKGSAEEVQAQLRDCNDAIARATGVTTRMIRAPYGSYALDEWVKSGDLVVAVIGWNKDSRDWEKPGVDKIVMNSTGNMQPGNIILMHDGGGEREQTLEALPKIIDAWQASGYTFVTMSELMASDPKIPRSVIELSANTKQ